MSMILDGTDEGNTAPTQEPPAWTVRDCAGHGDWLSSIFPVAARDIVHIVGCTCARPGGAS